ncbi:MAG: hypothetical protein NTW12_05810 [Deltaproteobacteria bacterium]|nr:hypothetical protein [Deltaproteobacteria bacterium]
MNDRMKQLIAVGASDERNEFACDRKIPFIQIREMKSDFKSED